MADLKQWITQRAHEDDRLYERYGRPLETGHTGEFVAISFAGETILGSDELTLAVQAAKHFGSGNFALRRVGYDAEIRWRQPLR